jgi:hypothetical protein
MLRNGYIVVIYWATEGVTFVSILFFVKFYKSSNEQMISIIRAIVQGGQLIRILFIVDDTDMTGVTVVFL